MTGFHCSRKISQAVQYFLYHKQVMDQNFTNMLTADIAMDRNSQNV